MTTTTRRAILALATTSLLLAGCSGGGGGKTASAPSQGATAPGIARGFVQNDAPAGEPVQGGTLTYALGVEVDNLDPATEFGAGSAGGSELAALYDSLVRYDATSGKYLPQLAEKLEANDDNTEWTVTLRDGVKFTDGTPLDAAAVKFSVERYIAAKGGWAGFMDDALDSVTADGMTAVFKLSRPWADFPFMLAQAPGNIVSPAGVKKFGEEFVRNPVGAGPFKLERWSPGEELVLSANPDYWNGKPYLDTLRFVPVATPQALGDLMNTQGADAAFLTSPQVIRTVLDGKFGGYVDLMNTGSILLINNGIGDKPRPGEDVRVRQAIAHAIDAKVIDQRVNSGQGLPGTEIFQSSSRWANSVGGPAFDQAKAKDLLAQAKAAGFDGKLVMVTPPTQPELGLTIQAMLNAVGFQVESAPVQTVQDLIRRVLVEGDFDIAVYGWSVPDEPGEVFARYFDRVGREGNPIGYDGAKLRELLLGFAATGDEAEKKSIVTQLQQVWNETMPGVPLAQTAQMVAWQENVHGIKPSSQLILQFDKAWIAK
ncbi:ABC transporter substrate-binding protein [Acrocarpospora macrocephala]|uniref:ABC transporter substrate-binding protein n=1 Tax=Acrocarpospora macrocephala TaxID=150177 RepID=A0A5M3WIN3_9ACTN|nr:ABC transporter substrate-binding protein [Acrocarpospora macrocephala]GES09017.1 ABC transporter substrate-binding protein [Acrocarpospora macrocephala]